MASRFAAPLFREEYPAQSPATAWPLSQAVAAQIAAARLLGPAARRYRSAVRAGLDRIGEYWSGAGYGFTPHPAPGSTRYFDDNDWLGLDFVAAYELLGDPALLRKAEQVFAFVSSGWDASGTGRCSGGVFWTTDPADRDRNTVSTANAALLGLELYLHTRSPGYLEAARRMYGWVNRCLLGADGLYADRIMSNGRIEPTRWSYNQGAMVAAGVLLYRATGDGGALELAGRTALRALAYFSPRYATEPPEFVAIFFRDLAVLADERPLPGLSAAIAGYAALRRAARGPDGLYRLRADGPARLLEQAAMTQIDAQLPG
ncbi:MAG TPA: glycoside hydrolase family 76 protein [Gaiellaceae bacterium]|nr:glycoside hydrolase family 76 protein [Gaiellaceae bacterium]